MAESALVTALRLDWKVRRERLREGGCKAKAQSAHPKAPATAWRGSQGEYARGCGSHVLSAGTHAGTGRALNSNTEIASAGDLAHVYIQYIFINIFLTRVLFFSKIY